MFGFLKDKIKSWVGKAKDSLSSKAPESEIETKKDKKKSKKEERVKRSKINFYKKIENKITENFNSILISI
jgi:hypothetical protein